MATLTEFFNFDQRRMQQEQDRTYLHGVDVTSSRFLTLPLVLAAVEFAAVAHAHQQRKTGEPYVTHCIETALIVEACLPHAHSLTQHDRHVCCIMAAVMHDVIDDTPTDLAALASCFGPRVAALVGQVSKLSQMNQLLRRGKRQGWAQYSPDQFKQLRKLIVDLAFEEPLVILVKLADRLHNMRTVYVLQPDKQRSVAEETMEVWCSMAESLGWDGLKSEMEDLCFAVLQPSAYAHLRGELDHVWNLPSLAVVGGPLGAEAHGEAGTAGTRAGDAGVGLRIVQLPRTGPAPTQRQYTRAAGVRAAGGRKRRDRSDQLGPPLGPAPTADALDGEQKARSRLEAVAAAALLGARTLVPPVGAAASPGPAPSSPLPPAAAVRGSLWATAGAVEAGRSGRLDASPASVSGREAPVAGPDDEGAAMGVAARRPAPPSIASPAAAAGMGLSEPGAQPAGPGGWLDGGALSPGAAAPPAATAAVASSGALVSVGGQLEPEGLAWRAANAAGPESASRAPWPSEPATPGPATAPAPPLQPEQQAQSNGGQQSPEPLTPYAPAPPLQPLLVARGATAFPFGAPLSAGGGGAATSASALPGMAAPTAGAALLNEPPPPPQPLLALCPQQQRLKLMLSTVVPFEGVSFKSLRGVASSTRRGLEVLDECAALLYNEIQIRSQAGGLSINIQGRLKSLNSVYRKMMRKNVAVAQVYDSRALRVIVDDGEGASLQEAVDVCYRLVAAVHSIWKPIKREFDDYIANPKQSGYQALHTAVRGPGGIPMEVQIKTSSMHELAEYGAAAHWVYKEYAGVGLLGAPAPRAARERGPVEPLPAGYEGQPLLKVAKDKLRYGVVVAREEDGQRLVAAVKLGATFRSFPTRVPDYAFYAGLQSYTRSKSWQVPGHGDLMLRLEEYVKCDDGRYHRRDHMGYLIPAETITLLEGFEEDAAQAVEAEARVATAGSAAGPPGGPQPIGGPPGAHVDEEALAVEGPEQRRYREQMRATFAKTQQLRSMIEWGREAIGKYASASDVQSDEVSILIWPGGKIEHFPRGTTAGDIVQEKGLIQTGEGYDGYRVNLLINVNNRLVPETQVLDDGDLVILAREKVRI